MKITRTSCPRANVAACVQVSHVDQDGKNDDYEEVTVVLEPYGNGCDLRIAHGEVHVPLYAIDETIRMLRRYKAETIRAEKRNAKKD